MVSFSIGTQNIKFVKVAPLDNERLQKQADNKKFKKYINYSAAYINLYKRSHAI